MNSKKYLEQSRKHEIRIEEREELIRSMTVDIRNDIQFEKEKIKNLKEQFMTENGFNDHYILGYKCEASPIKLCVFKREKSGYDYCVYCQPQD
jgi:hypothetical protein